ncbi:MAG: CvpA family protein [Clostridia bacterium]|nr:CvpA family protein [Clostridia bacterium]
MNGILSQLSSAMIADIGCIVIIAIFAIVNLCKGFIKQFFGLITTIGSLIIAAIFCDDLLKLINSQFDLTSKLSNIILSAFGDNQALMLETTVENLQTAITTMGLPQFVNDFCVNLLTENIGTAFTNIGSFLATAAANYMLSAACFAIICAVAKLVLIIVRKILELLVKLPVLHGINKLLGLILGLIKGVLFIYVVIFLIDIAPSTVPYITQLKSAISQSMIASFLQDYNLFSKLITWAMENLHLI